MSAADSDTTDTGSAGRTPPRENRRSGAPRRAGWALRREYRSTYRDTLVSSERVVAGRWAGRWAGHRAGTDSIAPVSFEAEVAKELGVTIGDRVTWDVQGVPVESRITSLREVDWARFEPNFFAVFPDGVLEHAPKQYVFLADVPGAAATASLQRSIGERYPNISSVDLSLIRDTVNGILRKITLAIRFLTIFCLLMGIPVLFSAVAATRRDRIRESVLTQDTGRVTHAGHTHHGGRVRDARPAGQRRRDNSFGWRRVASRALHLRDPVRARMRPRRSSSRWPVQYSRSSSVWQAAGRRSRQPRSRCCAPSKALWRARAAPRAAPRRHRWRYVAGHDPRRGDYR